VAKRVPKTRKGRTYFILGVQSKREFAPFIDGGSCANVVSLSMIEKLALQPVTHPHLYSIQWLNQSK